MELSVTKKILKLYSEYLESKQNENEKMRVRPIFTEMMRHINGHSDNLLVVMKVKDHENYYNYLRVTPAMFEKLEIIGPNIEKQYFVRDSIFAKTRPELTLRYLADGCSMTSLSYDFRIGKCTVIATTCEASWSDLKDIVFPEIKRASWESIACKFQEMWDFKNCIGAIDGKHVIIEAPPNSGSSYHNYKNCHSIHLLAVADAQSIFVMVDIGAQGRCSDGGVFRQSLIGRGFENNSFDLPPAVTIPGLDAQLPFVLVGDEAFALSKYMMRERNT